MMEVNWKKEKKRKEDTTFWFSRTKALSGMLVEQLHRWKEKENSEIGVAFPNKVKKDNKHEHLPE